MRNLICWIALIIMFPTIAWADCDWNTGITPGPNHTFIYSDACHLAVGALVQDAKVKDQQILDLTKAIQLKDLALTNSDSRVALWQKSSDDELSRLNTIQNDQKHSDWMYFGLGVLTTFAAGYVAAQALRH